MNELNMEIIFRDHWFGLNMSPCTCCVLIVDVMEMSPQTVQTPRRRLGLWCKGAVTAEAGQPSSSATAKQNPNAVIASDISVKNGLNGDWLVVKRANNGNKGSRLSLREESWWVKKFL